MRKIVFITTNLQGSGGVSRVLSVRLNYLVDHYGYDIHIISTNNRLDKFFYDFHKDITFHFVSIKKINLFRLFKYKEVLNNIISSIVPDIIVNCDNGFKGALLPYFVKNTIPLIYERHSSEIAGIHHFKDLIKSKLETYILKRSLMRYKFFVVLNSKEKEIWKSERVIVIGNPIWFSPVSNSNNLDSKIAIAVGRHVKLKQFDKLIKAWKEITKEYPDWMLKIYGESSSEVNLDKLIDQLKLHDYVELYGPQKNIEDVYDSASLVLSTSISEAFGLVILEAMARGVPVVSFKNVSGPENLITDNYDGVLVEKNNFKDYINQVKLLLSNKELRLKLSKKAKEKALLYDINDIMYKWHNLYQSV